MKIWLLIGGFSKLIERIQRNDSVYISFGRIRVFPLSRQISILSIQDDKSNATISLSLFVFINTWNSSALAVFYLDALTKESNFKSMT